MDKRQYPRTLHRVVAEIRTFQGDRTKEVLVTNIGMGGLFTQNTVPGLALDSEVAIRITSEGIEADLSGKVVHYSPVGTGVRFNTLTTHQQSLLHDIIHPAWDGDDLLEGVLMLSKRHEPGDLQSWMKLTGIAEGAFRKIRKGSLVQ